MEIKEYLEAIEACPAKELNEKHGIHDNWTILFDAKYEEVLEVLNATGKYKKEKDLYGKGGIKGAMFDYLPGINKITVMKNSLNRILDKETIAFLGERWSKEKREFYNDLNDSYSQAIQINPYQKKDMGDIKANEAHALEGHLWKKAITSSIIDISKKAMELKIPFCFPDSVGPNERENFSKRTKFTPSK